MLTALESNGKPAWQHDNSGITLAIIVLLHCARRMDKNQLLEVIHECL